MPKLRQRHVAREMYVEQSKRRQSAHNNNTQHATPKSTGQIEETEGQRDLGTWLALYRTA